MTNTKPFEFYCASCDDFHSAAAPTRGEVARAREFLDDDSARFLTAPTRYAAEHLRGALLLVIVGPGSSAWAVADRVLVTPAGDRFLVQLLP